MSVYRQPTFFVRRPPFLPSKVQPGVTPLVTVSADGRYLIDAAGKPFRFQCEAAWPSTTRATLAEYDTYFQDRKARGFNTILIMAIVQEGGSYSWQRANQNGDEPFTTVGHFDTPNDDYFDFLEAVIDLAASYGLLIVLAYTYVGFNGNQFGEGWWTDVAASHNTESVCYGWGQYLGNRFKNKANLIWFSGGDYTMPDDATRAKYIKIMDGIRSVGAIQLAGSEWGYPDSIAVDQAGYTYGTDPSVAAQNLSTFYAQGQGQNGQDYGAADRSWAASPTLPTIAEEVMWAYGTYAPIDSSRAPIRRYQHWAVTAGSTAGTFWGVWDIADWHVTGTPKLWEQALTDIVSLDQARAFEFYRHIPWWRMRPSGTASGYAGRELIVSGIGTGDSKITSSMTSDGMCLIAYVPPTGTGATTFSVDLRSMFDTARASWWNPTTGDYQSIGAFDNTLSAQSFTTPGDNGTGSNDWMLLLEVATSLPAVAAQRTLRNTLLRM